MIWRGLPIVVFGSGGISKEVYCLIKDINRASNQQIYDFQGFVGSTEDEIGNEIIDKFRVVSSDQNINDFALRFPVMGLVIPFGNPKTKTIIYGKVKSIPNSIFPNLIHPSISVNEKNIQLGIGNILTAGVRMTCDIKIGDFNLFNLNSTIGHDTTIGNFNVINPLVAISGSVNLMDGCLVGTGAQILQGLRIGSQSIIGAGAVVTKDIEPSTTVVGIPAKAIK